MTRFRPFLRETVAALTAGWLAGCTPAQAERVSVSPTDARPGESQAEALYRHGVNCMDVIERDECAVENFEQLVALDPPRRELVGDAIFRLVDLYHRAGETEEVKRLLRKFWEAGMRTRDSAILPYSTRYMTEHMTALVNVNVDQLGESHLFTTLPDDAKHMMFTCDEELRERLREQRKQRREQRRAERPPSEPTAAEQRRKERWEAGQKKAAAKPDPIYDDGLCHVARAFGQTDLRAWRKFSNAQNHLDPRLSMSALQIPNLDAEIEKALAAGTIVAAGDEVWSLAGVEYEDEAIQIAKLDREELMLAPARLMPQVLEAKASRGDGLRKDLRALAEQIPQDVVFSTVVTQDALVHGIEQSGNPLAGLLPTPEGLMISAVAYDYAGVFVRMPTSDPLKVNFLVALARKLVEGQSAEAEAEGDTDKLDFMRTMDISQTTDGRALVVSMVLSRGQVEKMFM